MGSEEISKVVKSEKRQGKKLSIIFVAFFLVLFVAYFTLIDDYDDLLRTMAVGGGEGLSIARPPPSPQECSALILDSAQTKNQTKTEATSTASSSSSSSSSSTSWTTKPIWFNMYPDTISDSVHAQLINPLTLTQAGGKSYYVSRKGKLRHCIGHTQTVTCANIHPAVEFKNGQLDAKYSTTFYEKYILVLRNPMTVFPSTVDAKNKKYHRLVGQTPENDWKKTRDEWFDGMIDGWKAVITAWRSTKYDVGVYLVYEDLFGGDVQKGSQTMLQLGTFLQEAGFTVPALEDNNLDSSDPKTKKMDGIDKMHCLWYDLHNNVGFSKSSERGEEGKDGRNTIILSGDAAGFLDYIPSYTEKQKDSLLLAMDSMIQEFEDDKALVNILLRYRKDIQKNMRIDK